MENVILKPLITEKSMVEAKMGKYTFVVDKKARKNDIRRAVQSLFKVHAVRVFTANIKGIKTKFTRKGKIISDLSYKKARVQLKKGESISVFEEKTK